MFPWGVFTCGVRSFSHNGYFDWSDLNRAAAIHCCGCKVNCFLVPFIAYKAGECDREKEVCTRGVVGIVTGCVLDTGALCYFKFKPAALEHASSN